MLPETGFPDWPTPLRSHFPSRLDDTAIRDAMATIPTSRDHHTVPPDLDTLFASLERYLTAKRMNPATLVTYSARDLSASRR